MSQLFVTDFTSNKLYFVQQTQIDIQISGANPIKLLQPLTDLQAPSNALKFQARSDHWNDSAVLHMTMHPNPK